MKRLHVVLFFFTVGLAVLVHQYFYWGKWFELGDFLHHENFAVIFFAVAFGLGFSIYLKKKRMFEK